MGIEKVMKSEMRKQLLEDESFKGLFFRRGLTAAVLNSLGKMPEVIDLFMMLVIVGKRRSR